MSMSLSANQFDSSYRPSRLGNWEVPAATRRAATVARDPLGNTKIIVDDNGHLLPGKSTKGASFPEHAREIPTYRWPDSMGSSTHKYCGGATMGYVLERRGPSPSPLPPLLADEAAQSGALFIFTDLPIVPPPLLLFSGTRACRPISCRSPRSTSRLYPGRESTRTASPSDCYTYVRDSS
jgi:hypothetical protein